ncbi:sugar-binding domain-containing protein [Verrucomicrobiota bacterium]
MMTKNRYAIIIGIDKYKHPRIDELHYAENDALSMRSIFTTKSEYRIPEENMQFLPNDKATKDEILTSIKSFAKKISKEDFFLFFYAGHGYAEKEGGEIKKYLAPYNADPGAMPSTAIDFDDLAKELLSIRSERLLIMLDCCYSGAGGRTFSSGDREALEKIGTDHLDKISGEGRIVMAACEEDKPAKETHELEHGIFSSAIIDGLQGDADYQKDGIVDSEELWMYVRQETINRSGKQQIPMKFGKEKGLPIFLSPVQSTKISEADKKSIAVSVADKFELQEVRLSGTQLLSDIGDVGAAYLEERIRRNMCIAVSCGSTLIEVITRIKRLELTNVSVFPMSGSPSEDICLTDSMMLSCLLLSRLGIKKPKPKILPMGIPHTFLAKGRPLYKALEDNASNLFKEASEKSSIYLCGVGSLDTLNDNIKKILEKANITIQDLRNLNVVGEINYHFFDKNGQFIAMREDLSLRDKKKINTYMEIFYSLYPETIEKIFASAGVETILVATGPAKRRAILAALRGKLFRTLITDVPTGRWLSSTNTGSKKDGSRKMGQER